MPHLKHFTRYRYTLTLIMSVFVVGYLASTEWGDRLIASVTSLGYLGAFISGIFFTSIFTVTPAGIVLFALAKTHDIILLSVVAGIGGVVGDYIIFRFVRDVFFEEVKPLFLYLGGGRIKRLFSRKPFKWFVPIIGAVIVASPLPDEIGIGLMGLSSMTSAQFLILTFVLDTFGLFVLLSVASLL